ncbi:hypothetical protein PCASD_15944 [Puccinia coronata f. sp. avenae]|uniref:HAT C-terminal dimerisation domain-containing protein n=1 Tax=Puccinia coronata f. sp. avenae TaxID=200324 RepID=A0A2N5TZD1_9BASI|nr:hypothetical protein PCASD_15944 [Puccinia coronata f. sp. avenae]
MPPQSPSPRITTSRPPSRHSTRAITPVLTDPNFIRPHQDSRKSLIPSQSPLVSKSASCQQHSNSPLATETPAKAVAPKKSHSKKRKVHVVKTDDTDANGSPAPIEIDMVQDSDQENSNFKCQKNKKKKKEQIFDNIKDYFEKPTCAENDSQPTPPSESENKDEQSHCALAEVDYFPDTVEVSSDDEISIYLGGKYKLPTSQANFPLKWWKEHSAEFPKLSLLARDYLACTATSASVERCFSAAADICGQD